MLSLIRLSFLGSGILGLFLFWMAISGAPRAVSGQTSAERDPNAACAPCHGEVVDRYQKTPMAHASGLAAEGFMPADFRHPASGVHYRIANEDGRIWLSYDREALTRGALNGLHGRQELRYFIGSGRRGRTYLFERQGYWFESPINWYARKEVWDMAPAYQSAREAPLTLPVDSGCLRCHASGVASALPDARNHYEAAPFSAGGITCVACHGDASAHVASGGTVHLSNIDLLQPVRRDSVCLSCHLEGQVSINRLGKRGEQFKAGDDLFEYTTFFTRRGEKGSGGRATSQWEALLRSACKRSSGDKLTCTSCHDPHVSPAPDERVAYYRKKCLACHERGLFAEKHHPENPDCVACHMARLRSTDIAHAQVTDHWIRKRAADENPPAVESDELIPIGSSQADDRDLGLAYAQLAVHGDQTAGTRALELLRRAEHTESGQAGDAELHSNLGFLEQVDGRAEDAMREYRSALDANPGDALAADNLAVIEAKRNRVAEAIRLWQSVVDRDPAQSGAAMNLAIVECDEGEGPASLAVLDRLLEFAPDDTVARDFADEIRSGHHHCGSP